MKAALLALCFATVVALSGCATIGAANQKIAADVEQVIAPVKAATIADAQACVADANAAGDADGAACCQDIADYLSTQSTAAPQIVGVLSALEVARTFKAPTLPSKLHKDCAVLVVDAQGMALRLGLQLAPVAGGLKVQAGAAALKSEAAALQAAESKLPHP